MNEYILVKYVQALSSYFIRKKNLEDFFTFIISSDSNSSVWLDLSHFIKHESHLFNFFNPKLCCDFSIKNLMRTLK